jgi:hypothetical protein
MNRRGTFQWSALKPQSKGRGYLLGLRLGLWCLTSLSTTFQLDYIGKFCWWRKLENLEKTTDLSKVTDKLNHIMLYCLSGIQAHNFNGGGNWNTQRKPLSQVTDNLYRIKLHRVHLVDQQGFKLTTLVYFR